MTFKKATLNFLALIDKDFDRIQYELIELLGDEGNDIGDAGNALELLSNQISETHTSYKAHQFRYALAKIIPYAQDKIKHIMMYLDLLATEKYVDTELKSLQTEYNKSHA